MQRQNKSTWQLPLPQPMLLLQLLLQGASVHIRIGKEHKTQCTMHIKCHSQAEAEAASRAGAGEEQGELEAQSACFML